MGRLGGAGSLGIRRSGPWAESATPLAGGKSGTGGAGLVEARRFFRTERRCVIFPPVQVSDCHTTAPGVGLSSPRRISFAVAVVHFTHVIQLRIY
ncbi:MAG: hypothetical protein AAB402_01415 [Patescibacteria group bacterium]